MGASTGGQGGGKGGMGNGGVTQQPQPQQGNSQLMSVFFYFDIRNKRASGARRTYLSFHFKVVEHRLGWMMRHDGHKNVK